MKKLALFAPLLIAAAAPAPVAAPPKPAPSPGEIVAAAPAADWVAINPADTLVMELAADAKGRARKVIIQLMPAPFSQGWVGNIRKLAAAHWWDGLAVVRVQDNYVAQWGDPDGDDPKKAKALPGGLVTVPESDYRARASRPDKDQELNVCYGQGLECPEYIKVRFHLPSKDSYATGNYFTFGWPFAFTDELPPAVPSSKQRRNRNSVIVLNSYAWPVHCYGMVGVGRNLSPDTGTGAELYTVIGHAPRHLDRNIALVGRVIEGMEHLSSLTRGHGELGFYDLAKGDERVPIKSIRLATELATNDIPRFEYLSTESASFAKYADARANRRDPFFIKPAGGADICNIPVPVRRVK